MDDWKGWFDSAVGIAILYYLAREYYLMKRTEVDRAGWFKARARWYEARTEKLQQGVKVEQADPSDGSVEDAMETKVQVHDGK